MLWASFKLSHSSAWVPRWVLAITLALLLLQLAAELWSARTAPARMTMQETEVRRARTVAAASWLGLLLLLTWLLGSAPGGAVFCCAWLRGHAGERWSMSLVFAAVLGIALWLLFTTFLGVGLYPGVLLPYLSAITGR
jgi:phosphate/sulfate permease